MSQLQYFNYKGFGENMRQKLWYSQAVRVADRIECSGQGGWDPSTSEMRPSLSDEIDQAFANVDLTLKTAGGKGWSQVYRSNMYVTAISEEGIEHVVRNLKKWCPEHAPLLTFIGVAELGLPGMRIEIEVVALDEEGAKKAAADRK